MRKLLAYLGAFCLLVGAAKDDSLSKADRERGVEYLQKTKKAVLDATKGLSDAQWNFKSAPDRWSVAEVLEHIAKSEDYLSKLASEQAMKGPPRPAGVNLKEIDELVLAQIPIAARKPRLPNRFAPPTSLARPRTHSSTSSRAGIRRSNIWRRPMVFGITQSIARLARSSIPISGCYSSALTASGIPSRSMK